MGKISFENDIEARENELLSRHSTFRTGGEADLAIFPKDRAELLSALSVLRERGERYTVIGNGSNILFDDNGYRGAVIFTKNMNRVEYIHKPDGTHIRAECGKMLTELAYEAGKKHILTGLEFAYGIPGTLGGAVYMNAGAYGGQMSDVVVESECFDTAAEKIITISAAEHEFGYRKSVFEKNKDLVHLTSTITLREGDREEIFALMDKNMNSRREKQPLEYPSAGSTFKRPGEGVFAGKLIEDAGLKGKRVGGAEVSEKHAGFIINRGKASSRDILGLIDVVKKAVYESSGYTLECEIVYIPEKDS